MIACAMHDIAKPINFVSKNQDKYNMPLEDIANLENLQNFIKNNYGSKEYEAAFKMCEDVGINLKSCQLVKDLGWENVPLY